MAQKTLIAIFIVVIVIVASIAIISPILGSYPPGSWQGSIAKLVATVATLMISLALYRWAKGAKN